MITKSCPSGESTLTGGGNPSCCHSRVGGNPYFKENIFYYISILVLFVLIVLRQWDRIHYLALYAEDGNLFLPRTIMYGYNSIIMPYAGYFQLAPQLISLLSYSITLVYYPIVTLFISSFIYIYAISLIVKTSYCWINTSQLTRFFIALSLTFIPGTEEIVGNLANLHSVLFILVTFRMLACFNEKYSLPDFVIFILTVFSAGEFFLIMPILLYRMFRIYKSKLSSIYMLQHLLILLILIASIVINYITAIKGNVVVNKNPVDTFLYFWQYLPKFLLTIGNRFFYLPFLGNLTILVNQHYITAIYTGMLMVFLVLGISIKSKMHKNSYFILLITALLSQMLEILLTVMVREPAANTPFFGQLTEISLLWVRYCIFTMPVVIIFWQLFINKLLGKTNLGTVTTNVILICISLYVIMLSYDRVFFMNFYRMPGETLQKKYLWPYNARLIYNMMQEGKPDILTLPSAPMGWTLTIDRSQK